MAVSKIIRIFAAPKSLLITAKMILIIEDDPRLAQLLRSGVEEAGYQVLLAHDAEMALRLFHISGSEIDLVLSDILLPGMSGLDLCRMIRSEQPSVVILMLTALGTTDDKLDGFDAGADDYMTKPFDFRELLARIAVLLRRNEANKTVNPKAVEENLLSCADLQLDLDRHLCKRGGIDIHLTPKEFALLRFLLENKGRIVSRADIQGTVWGTHFDTGTNFIDVYINYLRRKVDYAYSLKLIHTKPGVGFMLNDEG